MAIPWPDPAAPESAYIDTINALARERFLASHSIEARWRNAIQAGTHGRVAPEVVTDDPPSIRRFVILDTIRNLIATSIAGAAGVYSSFIRDALGKLGDYSAIRWLFIAASAVALIRYGPRLIRALWLLCFHAPVDGSFRQIAKALRKALHATGHITTPKRRTKLITRRLTRSGYSAALVGGTYYESALFADCLDELLSPIDNPRYLVTRRASLTGARDFHAVPRCLATKRELADNFFKAWKRHLGTSELIYTRTAEGRVKLLTARTRAFSNLVKENSRRRDRWY